MSPDFQVVVKERIDGVLKVVEEHYYAFDDCIDGIHPCGTNSMNEFLGVILPKGKRYFGTHISVDGKVSYLYDEKGIKWNIPIDTCNLREYVETFGNIELEYCSGFISLDVSSLRDYLEMAAKFVDSVCGLENDFEQNDINTYLKNSFAEDNYPTPWALTDFILQSKKWNINLLKMKLNIVHDYLIHCLLYVNGFEKVDDLIYEFSYERQYSISNTFRNYRERYYCGSAIDDSVERNLANWNRNYQEAFRYCNAIRRGLLEKDFITTDFVNEIINLANNSFKLSEQLKGYSVRELKDLLGERTKPINRDDTMPFCISCLEYKESTGFSKLFEISGEIDKNIKLSELFDFCGLGNQKLHIIDPETNLINILCIPFYDNGKEIIWNLDYSNATLDSFYQYYRVSTIEILPFNINTGGFGADSGTLFQIVTDSITAFINSNPYASMVLAAIISHYVEKGIRAIEEMCNGLSERRASFSSIEKHLNTRKEWSEEELMRKYKCSNKEDFEYFMIAFHYIKNSDGMYCKAKE